MEGVQRINQDGVSLFRNGAHAEAIRHFTEAANQLHQAAAADPSLLTSTYADADVGNTDTVNCERAALRRRELAIVLVNRARAYLGLGEPAKAVLDATEAVALDKNYGKAYRVLAEAYRADGRIAEATAAVTDGLRAAPGDARLLNLRAELPQNAAEAPRPDESGENFTSSLEIRLALLPRIFKEAALRSARLHLVGLVIIFFVLWIHRRPLARAWHGVDEPLSTDELAQARQWWSGFGLGLSFEAKVKIETIAEAGFERLVWDDFMEKAMGKKGQTIGRFLMLSWRHNASTNASTMEKKRGRKNVGKVTCKLNDDEICVLCFLPGRKEDLSHDSITSLKNKTVRGTLTRLGRDHRAWLQKTKWRGDGILPLLFSMKLSDSRSTSDIAAQRGVEHLQQFPEGVPDRLAGRRAVLVVALFLVGFLFWGIAVAVRAYFDFTKHPSFKMLKSFPDIAPSALTVAREIDREACDDSVITGSRVMQGGRVIITCSWLIHCPNAWTFAERILQPFKSAVAFLLGPSTFVSALSSRETNGKKMNMFTALSHDLREWLQLIACSGFNGVEITRLRDCVMSSRSVFSVHLGPHWDSLQVSSSHRLVLKDARLGLFIEIPHEAASLEELAREIALRQAVDHRAFGARRFPFGPQDGQDSKRSPMFSDPVNRQSMTLEDCCEALGISRADLRPLVTAQETKLLLRRAFRKRALTTHPDKAGEDQQKRFEFERACIALEVLCHRLDDGLQM